MLSRVWIDGNPRTQVQQNYMQSAIPVEHSSLTCFVWFSIGAAITTIAMKIGVDHAQKSIQPDRCRNRHSTRCGE
jgi:hypothetical protein